MDVHKASDKIKIPLSFISNILIIVFFIQALFNPEPNISWIYERAILIFIFEFLSMHSAGMGNAFRLPGNRKRPSLILFIFYLIFSVVAGIIFDNFILPFFFAFSTFIKFFIAERLDNNKTYFIQNIAVFIGSIIIMLMLAPFMQQLVPFSDAVLSASPEGMTGLFIDEPQSVLIWGIIYFTTELCINTWFILKKR